jgi:hypothetical protein
MCCLFTILFLLGARAVDVVWWIAQLTRWSAALSSVLWPILGIIVDVGFWSGGAYGNRDCDVPRRFNTRHNAAHVMVR